MGILAHAINAPGAGSVVGALGLIDSHQLAASRPRGNDVLLVLRHDERHSHRHTAAHHGHESDLTENSFAGVGHDEDHIVVLPHTSDSSAQCTSILVPLPGAGASPALFEAGRVRVPLGVLRIARLPSSARPRAGPEARLRVTELRI